MKPNALFSIAALATCPLCYSCASNTEPRVPAVKLIVSLPDGAVDPVFVSDDGTHWCVKVKQDDGVTVIGDRSYSPRKYKVIADIEWSPKTGRCGFWAQTPR